MTLKKGCLLVLFFAATCAAFAGERITRFASSVDVGPDGRAWVTEEISVIVEHEAIRRGIYRDIPSTRKEPVKIIGLEMDGQTHPFFTERNGRDLRVNFGDDGYISRGPHTYRLQYVMQNAVRFFRDYDEIYWNVTGNYWNFPIDQAVFALRLPEGARPDEARVSVYTGPAGSKEGDASRRGLLFWSTRPLAPREGFTVAVPWQKGIVTAPPPAPAETAQKNRNIALVACVLLALWLYYWWAWRRVGRDPRARVVRRFDPPEGFCAPVTGYVYNQGMRDDLLAVTVTSLAVKGALEIQETRGFMTKSYVLKLVNRDAPLLSEPERAALSVLFSKGARVEVGESRRSLFLRANRTLETVLKNMAGTLYFTENKAYNIPTALAGGVFLLSAWRQTGEPGVMMVGFVLGTVSALLFYSMASFRKRRAGFGAYFSALVFCVIGYVTWTLIPDPEGDLPALWTGVVLAGASGGLFWEWIKAYTPTGREKMNQIEGFKEYLEIGEGGRIEMSNPADAARIFCDYLPYAYALGVESRWIKAFQSRLSEAMLDSAARSRGLCVGGAAGFASAMRSFNSAVVSSGGSGGRGVSGGGSGGGGGGGR